MKKKHILFIALGLVVIGGGIFLLHPHKYTQTIVSEPTCTKDGNYQYKCWCGGSYIEEPESTGHAYENEVTVEATCIENGVNTYTCTVCEDSYTEEIESLGHDLQVDIKEVTCEEAGYEKNVCSRCDYTQEEVFEAFGHDYELAEESKTEKVYVCAICENSYTEKVKTKPQKSASAQNSGAANPSLTDDEMMRIALEMGCTTGIDTTGNTDVADWDRETSVDISGVILH